MISKFFLKLLFNISIIIIIYPSVSIPQISERINKVTYFDKHVFGRDGNYDAILLVARRIENRKLLESETYDKLQSECTAQAFFKSSESPMGDKVDKIFFNGREMQLITVPATNFKYYSLNSIFIDTAINPRIDWNITGNLLFPNFNGASMNGQIKFPEFYYIIAPQNVFSVGDGQDYAFSVAKSNTEPVGFRLPNPDIMQAFLYLPEAADVTKEFQSENFDALQSVTENTYTFTYPHEVKQNWFKRTTGELRVGPGALVLRTYKFTDKLVAFPDKPIKQHWLFVTIVETEYPITFSE